MSLGLVVDELVVTGEAGRRLLQIDCLTVPAGGSLAISGPSGAGKSTLLFALAGLLPDCTGTVRWECIELISQNDAARCAFRREHVGLIFQDFLLFEELDALANATLAANFAPRSARDDLHATAEAALARLHIDEHRGRRVDSLSGGERQRVALARALVGGPSIILADEPTASLDRAMADRLIEDLLAAAHRCGSTLVLVTHDERLQARLARHLRLEDGRLLA